MRLRAAGVGGLLLPLCLSVTARAEFNLRPGDVDLGVGMGTSFGSRSGPDRFLKAATDVTYMILPGIGICGTPSFAMGSDGKEIGAALGIRLRNRELFRYGVDIGMKIMSFGGVMQRRSEDWFSSFGVLLGPTFRYFFSDRLGFGADLNLRLGSFEKKGMCSFWFPSNPGIDNDGSCPDSTRSFGLVIDWLFTFAIKLN